MILYNVTTILDEGIQQEWLSWMKEQHIPEVMATSCFVSSRMLKVLDSPNEGVTYCVQYIADTMDNYNDYLQKYAPALRSSFPASFADKFVIYRSLMEFIA
jgi:hypothetical protein